MQSIKFKDKRLFYLDQTKLPQKELWIECKNLDNAYYAIKSLKVRGAPLIGVFAAYAIYIHLKNISSVKNLKNSFSFLKSCRPTAVNLSWALECLEARFQKIRNESLDLIRKETLKEAQKIHRQDIELCENMAKNGLSLIRKGDSILTHCNSGVLATSGIGTALGVIHRAKEAYKDITVYVDETRPLLQGSRLTAWELMKKKIKAYLICDNMAAALMDQRRINKIFLGADRIAANGDTANKIGTYNLAILAKYHKIPFYVVAPTSTFDLKVKNGHDIAIEERRADEVKNILGQLQIAPDKIKAKNPAFDITPNKLITAIVSDKGIIYPPFRKNIAKIIK